MSGEVPDSWRLDTLANLTKQVKRGATPSYSTDATGIFAISQKCVRDGSIDLSAARPHDPAKAVPPKARLLPGDVCVNSTGTGTLGRVALWEHDEGQFFADTHVTVVRPDINQVEPFTLAAFLGALSTRKTIYKECVTGSTNQIELSAAAFGELVVPVPPLDEQRRIAEVLRSVDEVIAVKQNMLSATKQFKRSCREAAVQRFRNCEAIRLKEVLASIDAGWSPNCDTEPASDGEWSILKTSAVVWEGYDDSENKRLPAHLEPRPQLEVAVDDILITRAGPAERTGVVTIVRETAGRRMLSDKIIRLRVCPTKAIPLAVAELLASDEVQDELVRSKSGMAASQTNISQKIALGLEMRLPPLVEQQDFAHEMAALQDVIELAETDLLATLRLKALLTSDLLSGRVRVPSAVATGAARSVPPAFKRAVFAAEIVHQLHNDHRFGSVKHEKIVHVCELHLGLQAELDRHAYKEAAGPYDPKARRSVERIFQQQKWFDAMKPDGNRVVYVPLEKSGGHAEYFDRYFGDRKPAIQSIIDLLRPLSTEQCEIVATLYAVWNDFLIDKRQPGDDEIVASVLQWHSKKQQITKDRWLAALPWMRQKGLIPKGYGEKTRVAQT